MSTTKSHDDRKAELAEKRKHREEAEEQRRKDAELEELELEDRFCESHGRRGSNFEILDFTEQNEGFVVLTRGEAVLHKKFKAAVEKAEASVPDQALKDYVLPCVVHPSHDKFLELASRLPIAWNRCANAEYTLHGARRKVESGKF